MVAADGIDAFVHRNNRRIGELERKHGSRFIGARQPVVYPHFVLVVLAVIATYKVDFVANNASSDAMSGVLLIPPASL